MNSKFHKKERKFYFICNIKKLKNIILEKRNKILAKINIYF